MLIISFIFAVYKNFTAIDTHTVTEKETVEFRLNDTNAIENFVIKFAKVYYSWKPDSDYLTKRENALSDYLTSELQSVNDDIVRSDVTNTSTVQDVTIWDIVQESDSEYSVIFEIEQKITENEKSSTYNRTYELTVYVDEDDKLVIVKNPTIHAEVEKSSYEPQEKQTDSSIDTETKESIDEFLETFFKLYPSATDKELTYYVENEVLQSVNENYLFSSIEDVVYIKDNDGNIEVSLYVEYIDKDTKATQVSQYDLTLKQDGDNWKIIK